jgi:hypothetical protein
VSVPFGIRNLFIGCSHDKQFGGILRLLQELNSFPGSHRLEWPGELPDLSRRRVLQRVLISGHGSPTEAGFELDSTEELRPSDLRLPGGTSLYLVGCYQGRKRQRRAWADGTGVDTNRVWGCSGETESALSTCLLLHLMEDGPDSIDRWFPLWKRCNRAFRPYFPMIREVYARRKANPLAALADLKAAGNLDLLFEVFDEFLAVITRSPAYLSDLV